MDRVDLRRLPNDNHDANDDNHDANDGDNDDNREYANKMVTMMKTYDFCQNSCLSHLAHAGGHVRQGAVHMSGHRPTTAKIISHSQFMFNQQEVSARNTLLNKVH